jgi:hypothetical protein
LGKGTCALGWQGEREGLYRRTTLSKGWSAGAPHSLSRDANGEPGFDPRWENAPAAGPSRLSNQSACSHCKSAIKDVANDATNHSTRTTVNTRNESARLSIPSSVSSSGVVIVSRLRFKSRVHI